LTRTTRNGRANYHASGLDRREDKKKGGPRARIKLKSSGVNLDELKEDAVRDAA